MKALVGGDCLQSGFYVRWVEEIDKVHSTTEPGLIPGDSDYDFSSGTLANDTIIPRTWIYSDVTLSGDVKTITWNINDTETVSLIFHVIVFTSPDKEM